MLTVEKCVRILTLLSGVSPVMSVSEIALHLGLPQSTTYRYISALKKHRLIEQGMKPGTYHLGTRILELARGVSKRSLREISLPLMRRLSSRTGESILLSGVRHHSGVCLEKVEGHHALRVSHEVGATFPLHAGATGKVLMAYLAPEKQDEVIEQVGLPSLCETTITEPVQLKENLKLIRDRGFALSDGEIIRGTYGIAAPIFSRKGEILAALSVSAPDYRLEGKKRERTIRLILVTARQISREMSLYDMR